ALAFDVEYARWLEEHNRKINELRTAVNSHAGDAEIRIIVDSVTTHFDDIFRLKGTAAKADVFHILSGMWKTPAERCFLWIGGFRSSELLKLLANQLEPLTEQQFMGIQKLQQSSQQAEDSLSQGMEALQQSLAETLANGSPSAPSGSSGNVANYMGQMAMAMGKLGTLEGFLLQCQRGGRPCTSGPSPDPAYGRSVVFWADNLRQQTLQQMHRILTTRQSARALLAINDYFSRLRALSSLWLARPRELYVIAKKIFAVNESGRRRKSDTGSGSVGSFKTFANKVEFAVFIPYGSICRITIGALVNMDTKSLASVVVPVSNDFTSGRTTKHYVVYMGSSAGKTAESDHLQLLSTVIPREERERISITNHYNHALRGFSAMLTDDEASELS
ncbi:hypothetical protein Goklo_000148, partial [Gossypium klotzschianum]|nr:hypothetical protein [Gossypium klotzschianum]